MPAARSHTDTLTNVVVLSALDVGHHLHEIVDRDLPIATLPTFLHEATHHWCFDTPVGLALHLLFMRARRMALEGAFGAATRDDGWNILDHVVRYELVRDAMRPISEGLALFAEHDAIPGTAKTISTPMIRAAALYGRGYAVLGDAAYERMPDVLAAARVSRHHSRHKAALMLESFTCANGGYLPGYLLVKGLWQYARRESPLFRDSDFFLQYLREHVFGDWTLVARLLDDSAKDIGALDPISRRISEQMRVFVETAFGGGRPERFETFANENRFETTQVRTDLVNLDISFFPLQEGPEVDLGRRRLLEGLTKHFAAWPDNEVVSALLDQDRGELLLRSVVNLGHAMFDAESVDGGMHLSFERRPLVMVPSARFTEDVSGLEGPMHVEVLSFAEPGSLCLTLAKDGRLVGSVPIGAIDVDDTLRRWLVGPQERADRVTSSQALIDEAIDKADLRKELKIIQGEMRTALDDWFLPVALMHVESGQLADVRRRMAEGGMLKVFEGSRGLLLDAAVASMCIPSPYHFGSVKSFHEWSEETPQLSVLRITQLVGRTLGFPAFAVDGNGNFEKVSFI